MATTAFRGTRRLLRDTTDYVSSHKYYLVEGRTPFWRKFMEYTRVNPGISSGIPLNDVYRQPPPGSRPEHHSIPPSKASDIAGNLYHNRDFRRKYEKIEMVTQEHLTKLLLAQPNEDGTKTLPAAPAAEGSSGSTDVTAEQGGATALVAPSNLSEPKAFTDVLAQVHKAEGYSAAKLPPTPPFKRPHHILKVQPGAVPHDEHAYYPAENYA